MIDKKQAHERYIELMEKRESLLPMADMLEEEGAAMNREIEKGIGLDNRDILVNLAGLRKRHYAVRDELIDLSLSIRALEVAFGFAAWRIPKYNPPILKNVTLAAIVRDEEQNPAGGLVGWINSTVPYVESAVILDTTSTDRTLNILKSAMAQFKNLAVCKTYWEGFSKARNRVMKMVRTPRALILDADEIIADEFLSISRGFGYLAREFGEDEGSRFSVPTKLVYADLQDNVPGTDSAINPRLVFADDYFQTNQDFDYNEFINTMGDAGKEIKSPVAIWHFLPGFRKAALKQEFYYKDGSFMMDSPRDSAAVYGWKEFNPRRHLIRD